MPGHWSLDRLAAIDVQYKVANLFAKGILHYSLPNRPNIMSDTAISSAYD